MFDGGRVGGFRELVIVFRVLGFFLLYGRGRGNLFIFFRVVLVRLG